LEPGRETIRLDKWLWHARFFRTRTLAARVVAAGRLRVNAARVTKPSTQVGPGDTLTFPQGPRVRVVRVRAAGARRGPAEEARTLYDDLDPPGGPAADATGRAGAEPGGRPDARARRARAAFRRPPLD